MADVGRLGTDNHPQLGPRPDLIARSAARRWGAVARWELLEAGLGIGAIKYALRTGRLRQVHRGVYMVGGAALCIEARWSAAVLACGPGAVLSHRDAAALHELLLPPRRRLIDVTTPLRTRGRQDGIDLHRTRHLPPSSVMTLRGIPTTTVTRTLIDLPEVAPANHLARAVDEADRTKRLDLDDLDHQAASLLGRHGAPRLTTLLRRHRPTGFSRSDLERRFLSLTDAVGLSRPLVNKEVEGYEVDFHWPDLRLVVEVDGYEWHRTRRRFVDDRARDRALTLAGWRILRIPDETLVYEPAAVEADLRRAARA
jgi:hypothetical protein